MKKYSQFILTYSFDCPFIVVRGNNFPINLVTSVFFRKNLFYIPLLPSSKLRLFAKQYNMLESFFKKNLLTFEWINIIRLPAFEWINIIGLLPEPPFFSFHSTFIFSFQIMVITFKFNQDKNFEFVTREFYSR